MYESMLHMHKLVSTRLRERENKNQVTQRIKLNGSKIEEKRLVTLAIKSFTWIIGGLI